MSTESKPAAEALIPQFHFDKLLNQDQNGRRIALLGSICSSPALITLERAAFPSDPITISTFLQSISNTTNLGANDVYRWYLANHSPSPSKPSSSPSNNRKSSVISAPDLKINLFYPCTDAHIKKYSAQHARMVTETPEIYRSYIRPYMQRRREQGRLNWVFNIIEGRAEQEDVIIRDHGGTGEAGEGFLLLPDLNWDRKTLTGLHLLALVERRDIWSLRDLTKRDVPWLKRMRENVMTAATKVYPEVERDELKLYVHYQPTYYHFHIHVVHVMLEAGTTQATGKAFGLENIISQLETMAGADDAGMANVSLTYFLGEASELWTSIFARLKQGQTPVKV